MAQLGWWDRLLRAGEPATFKRVPHGWIYASPIWWWPVGRQKYFLLSDAQKNDVSEILRRWQWHFAALLLLLYLPLLVSFWTFPSLLSNTANLLAVFAVYIVCMQPLCGAFFWLILHRTLAGAQRTSERITIGEKFNAFAAAIPRAFLIFYVVFFVLLLVFFGYGAIITKLDFLTKTGSLALAGGGLAICWWLLRVKSRARQI
jgi:hypothetical protein